MQKINTISFTFHYASTYTQCGPRGRLSASAFTFHYASTYTQSFPSAVRVVEIIYIPLCLYLYSRIAGKENSVKGIYIPLCFYLYLDKNKEMIMES